MAKHNLRNEVALSDEGSSSKDSQSEERRGACGEGQGPDVVSQVPRESVAAGESDTEYVSSVQPMRAKR